jgi:hypothetical protein
VEQDSSQGDADVHAVAAVAAVEEHVITTPVEEAAQEPHGREASEQPADEADEPQAEAQLPLAWSVSSSFSFGNSASQPAATDGGNATSEIVQVRQSALACNKATDIERVN